MRVIASGPVTSVRRALGCALSLVALLATPLAQPAVVRAEPELAIEWSMPSSRDDCADGRWAGSRVAEQLGRPARADVDEGVKASASIVTVDGGLQLTVRTGAGGEVGERVIDGVDCRVLGEAAALIIALAVAEASERAAAQQPTAQAARPPERPATPAVAPPPAVRRAGPRFVLRADALLAVGFLDRALGGPALSFGASHRIWRGELAGFWLVPRRLTVADDADGPVRASLWAGRATGCALWGAGPLRAGPCLAAELGQARGEGEGSPTTRRARSHTLWAAGALGGRMSVAMAPRIALVLQAELLLAIARPRFVTADAASGARASIHEPAVAQLRASLGAELRF